MILNTKINHIMLTTFPAKKSRNVGDNLICHSALRLIQNRAPAYNPLIKFRKDSLDGFSKKNIQHVVAPGFSVSNNVYPDLYHLFSDVTRLKYFFPIGCSFQHIIPSKESYLGSDYNKETLSFLNFITERFGALPCRDMLIVEMLRDRLGIPAVYSGDLAIYDEDIIGSPFLPPKQIKSIVFTIQHHLKYKEQSLHLLNLIKKEFPDSKLYIALHSKPAPLPLEIANYASEKLGFEVLHMYGDVSNLLKYDTIDLHIGYRLHGHICFLRKRKPSILLIEDARSFGFANTEGTDFGCIDAFCLKSMSANEQAPELAMAILKEQIRSKFEGYNRVFKFIDETFHKVILPYFDNFVKKIPYLQSSGIQ